MQMRGSFQASKRMTIQKKMRGKSGETLVETLAAVMIAAMGLLVLPGAIVAASRINAKAGQAPVFMEVEEGGAAASPAVNNPAGTANLVIKTKSSGTSSGTSIDAGVTVDVYKDDHTEDKPVDKPTGTTNNSTRTYYYYRMSE